MIELYATYTQQKDGKWNATIQDVSHITVYNAEDLATARAILRIITAEEVAYMVKGRADWDIVHEDITYYRPGKEEAIGGYL